jgi:hypothetical protein
MGDIKPLLKYFIALYYRQGTYYMCILNHYSQTLPSAYQGRREEVYIK